MKNEHAGVTLVELMMTIMLIAIVAVTGLAFLTYCDRYAMIAYSKVAAANLARETMEGCYMTEYYNLVKGENTTIIDKVGYRKITVTVTCNP